MKETETRLAMGVFLIFFTAINLLNYMCPGAALSDAGFFEVNVEYLKNAKFATGQRLLELNVNLKAGHDGAWLPRKIKFYSAPKSSKTVECTINPSLTVGALDCGLVPMSLSAYVERRSYVFKVLKQENNWLQLPAPSTKGESLWMNKKEYVEVKGDNNDYSEISFRVKPISEWMLGLYGFGIVDSAMSYEAYIYANPDEKGKTLGSCRAAEYRAGGGLMKTRGQTEKTWRGETRGDWANVFCDRSDCFAEDSPHFLYSDELPELKLEKAERQKLKGCVRGWARWRSDDGHILLYPTYMVSH